MKFIIYTDGACSGNPGPGGWGAVIGVSQNKTTHICELGDGEKQTTNNRMELMATVASLQWAYHYALKMDSNTESQKSYDVQMYTDSVYVIKGITQWIFGWKKKGWKNAEGQDVLNKDIWEALDQIVFKIQNHSQNKIQWSYVRGHQGTPGNERCDQIAVAFSKKDYVQLYQGEAKNYHFDILTLPMTEEIAEKNWTKPNKPKDFWYVVLKNGVLTKFKTWSECEASVKGYPGVKFKKVTSASEEAEVLKSWGIG